MQKEDFLESAMTVAELIERLENLDPSARVVFTCDYGDICHTPQALAVKSAEEYDARQLAETGYSQSGFQLTEEPDDDDPSDPDDGPEGALMVVLS